MEYNYTRELNQPHKIYTVHGYSLPLFPEGVRADFLIVFGLLAVGVLALLGVAIVFQIDLVTSLFKHDYLLILLGIGLVVWILFTLQWDKKNFFAFVLGRVMYKKKSRKVFEHVAEAPIVAGSYQYKPFKQQTYFGRKE